LDVTSELVERAQRGDHEAFDALASAAYHRLYAIARRILRDGYAAEDAVQDAMVKAWRDLRGLRDPEAFDAWLHRLLVNACNDQVRRTRRRPVEVPDLTIDRAAPQDDLARLADRDELERAFLDLSVEHRAVLVLSHYVGLSNAEVARILRVPPGTVASRLHYGARAMRAAISRDARSPIATPEPGR
jgi:RNA polymerase sigma-70 factor (ECF subfamily)